QFESLRQIAKLGEDNLVWSYAQLYGEYTRLRYALVQAQLEQGSPESLENLQLRYDIFVSRIDLVEQQPDREFVAGHSMFKPTLVQLREFIAEADRLMGPDVALQYNPAEFRRLDQRLAPFETPILTLTLSVNEAVMGFAHSRRE